MGASRIHPQLGLWAGFIVLVVAILAVDLGVLNRKAHVVSIREAFLFTVGLFCLAMAFNVLIYFLYSNHWAGLGTHVDKIDGVVNTGSLAAVKFFTGYIVEISLSADNVFIMAMIFHSLRVPPQYQHRVLFWGILGALVMRGLIIFAGAHLVERYHWLLYLFGAFLIFTAYRMLAAKGEPADIKDSLTGRWIRKFFPVTPDFHGQRFAIRHGGRRMLTPLALALIFIETTDLVFAVDSIPAIFAITTDPFIVFTSNVFAILGLRSLYFALAGAIEKFKYLKKSLAAILALVGAKMLAADLLEMHIGPAFNYYMLGMVALILGAGIAASAVATRRDAGSRPA